ncbi:Solute carrier family 22 member 3 [Myotis davidii]|uniref:Solute carrier family 22 member 3 n=1 Tax=Myotis davidii TaxID=225400 RepID=L5M872_MYODS|nr:Solute carrier family 22 member 3 [Myotis davidii]
MLDLTQAILNLGFLAGAFTLGYAADRYGRIVVYLISCFGVGVTGVVVAFAPNFPVFVVFRFLQGVFAKGTWMTCYVIVTEIVGSKQRRIVGIVIQMFFTLGIIILPGIAYFIPNWQGIQLAITLPNFLFLLYYWAVPESPRWLVTRKKGDEALKILRSIAKCNGKYLSPSFSEVHETGADVGLRSQVGRSGFGNAGLSVGGLGITVTDEEVSNPSFLDLVRTPQMRKCTLILMFAWFTSALVYQGLVMRLGIVGGNLYMNFFISGVVELPAALLILLTIERLGRRLPFAASNILAGVACLVTAFLPEGTPWLRTTVATLGRLGITMAFEIVYLVNSELYPTTLRNFGVSLCSGLCDFGGIIAPFLLFRLAALWLELPLIIFGVLASVCGGLVMLLPETKGIALPETVDDVEKLGRYRMAFSASSVTAAFRPPGEGATRYCVSHENFTRTRETYAPALLQVWQEAEGPSSQCSPVRRLPGPRSGAGRGRSDVPRRHRCPCQPVAPGRPPAFNSLQRCAHDPEHRSEMLEVCPDAGHVSHPWVTGTRSPASAHSDSIGNGVSNQGLGNVDRTRDIRNRGSGTCVLRVPGRMTIRGVCSEDTGHPDGACAFSPRLDLRAPLGLLGPRPTDQHESVRPGDPALSYDIWLVLR